MGRGRSRSRSRSRTRGRSRSRSLSRGRERGRGRSRSGSISDDSPRGKDRSHSPTGDYGRPSYGSSDKRSAPDKSSQICRDFTAGKCRRGTECRFLHPKSVSRGDSAPWGDGTGEPWQEMTKNDQISTESFSKGPQSNMQEDRFDPYRGQNEQFQGRSINSVPCKDFIKGKCRWGGTCRFSHDSGYAGTSERSTIISGIVKPVCHSSRNENRTWGIPELTDNEHSSQLTNSTVAVTDQHVTPVTVPSLFPNQRFMTEQPQKNIDAQDSNCWGVAPFSNSLGNASLVNAANLHLNQARVFHEQIGHEQSGRGINEHGNHKEQSNEMKVGQFSPLSTVGKEPGNSEVGHPVSTPKMNPETLPTNPEVDKGNTAIGNESKGSQNNTESETLDRHGKVEEKSATKDDKARRTFKNSLIEFVKDLLKPTWKEGKMSREVHKTIVKKVVEKVTSTIQADHIPKTQDKVDQYLSYSKPKIAKLVEAYVGRCLKEDTKS